MRTIKFRGKRVDNGEWVEVYYVLDPLGFSRIYLQPFSEATSNTYYFVDPTTVGQFTGLTDKNDKDIFEGDLLKSEAWCCKCEVIYKGGGYTIKEGDTSLNLATNLVDMDDSPLIDVEVTGNVHDKNETR